MFADYIWAGHQGNVEFFAIVLATSSCSFVVIGPVTLNVDIERTSEEPISIHEQSLVQYRIHSELQINFDFTVILFFMIFLKTHCIVICKVSPSLGIGIIPVHVSRFCFLTRLTRIFLFDITLLHRDVSTSLNWNQHHQRHENGQTCYFAHDNA